MRLCPNDSGSEPNVRQSRLRPFSLDSLRRGVLARRAPTHVDASISKAQALDRWAFVMRVGQVVEADAAHTADLTDSGREQLPAWVALRSL